MVWKSRRRSKTRFLSKILTTRFIGRSHIKFPPLLYHFNLHRLLQIPRTLRILQSLRIVPHHSRLNLNRVRGLCRLWTRSRKICCCEGFSWHFRRIRFQNLHFYLLLVQLVPRRSKSYNYNWKRVVDRFPSKVITMHRFKRF